MGYLPGYAPRVVCDVPYVGKRWVHKLAEYDRVKGISYWKNYLTSVDSEDITTGPRRTPTPYPYYDPIATARHRAAVVGRPAALRPSFWCGAQPASRTRPLAWAVESINAYCAGQHRLGRNTTHPATAHRRPTMKDP
jgi:hypothetical protein